MKSYVDSTGQFESRLSMRDENDDNIAKIEAEIRKKLIKFSARSIQSHYHRKAWFSKKGTGYLLTTYFRRWHLPFLTALSFYVPFVQNGFGFYHSKFTAINVNRRNHAFRYSTETVDDIGFRNCV
jgi:hypothetical protein